MARARNLKYGFFTNEMLVELPYSHRLLFAGLWLIADREGRLEDRPKKIKMELFPADNLDVDKALSELQASDFILRYEVEGRRYIQVVNFSKHQNPHHKEPASKIPKPGASPGLECHATAPEPETLASTLCNENPGHALDPPHPSPIPTVLIPDSGFLIPDPREKALSGSAPDAPPVNGSRSKAVEVLDFLNARTGRNYQRVDANLRLIAARLREGATVDDCRAVIAKKYRDWSGDDKMRDFLRPATLFNATKFAQYRGELSDGNPQVVS